MQRNKRTKNRKKNSLFQNDNVIIFISKKLGGKLCVEELEKMLEEIRLIQTKKDFEVSQAQSRIVS